MMEKYLIGTLAVAGLMLAWVGIQALWRHAFSENLVDEDVLAGRTDCGNCGCLTACEIKKSLTNKKK